MAFLASRARIPSTIARSLGSAPAAILRISSMLAGFSASGRHMSVITERPRTRIAAVDGHQNFGYGGHADGVGADGPKAVFGPGLQVRPGYGRINTFVGGEILMPGDFQGKLDQRRMVRAAHVRETGAQRIFVRADKRVSQHEVNVVLDDHYVAEAKLGFKPPQAFETMSSSAPRAFITRTGKVICRCE